jgi:hypothetical protein
LDDHGHAVPDSASLRWRIEAGGCPACNAASRAEVSSVGWFLRENYHQAETQKALVRRRFCRQHLAMLLASRDPHLGVTLEFLARRQAETLERFRDGLFRRRLLLWRRWSGGRRGLPADAEPVDPADRCQFCAAGRTAATVAIADVIEILHDSREQSAYLASDGFCCPHGWNALREAPAPLSDWLAGDMQRRLRQAEAAIDSWYASRRGGEPQISADQAWARAAELLWGSRAPGRR